LSRRETEWNQETNERSDPVDKDQIRELLWTKIERDWKKYVVLSWFPMCLYFDGTKWNDIEADERFEDVVPDKEWPFVERWRWFVAEVNAVAAVVVGKVQPSDRFGGFFALLEFRDDEQQETMIWRIDGDKISDRRSAGEHEQVTDESLFRKPPLWMRYFEAMLSKDDNREAAALLSVLRMIWEME
jgi:hypothetical protein